MAATYGRRVFEKLLWTATVRFVNKDTITSVSDDLIAPHYDIKDDGVHLKVDTGNDWSPACERGGPDDPDPLTTPALPFPFLAQEFAAFVLDGWGYFLGSKLMLVDESLDAEFDEEFDGLVNDLLGGVADVKPQVAVRAARKHLQNARETVEALRVKQAVTSRACEDAEPAWRKAMVNALSPPSADDAQIGCPPGMHAVRPEPHAEERQRQRYEACQDAGLVMPTDEYKRLPRGINRVAEKLKISRQSLSEDVKAHIGRLKLKGR